MFPVVDSREMFDEVSLLVVRPVHPNLGFLSDLCNIPTSSLRNLDSITVTVEISDKLKKHPSAPPRYPPQPPCQEARVPSLGASNGKDDKSAKR